MQIPFLTDKGKNRLWKRVLSFFILLMLSTMTQVRADAVSDRVRELFSQGWTLEGLMHEDLANLDKAVMLHEEALALAPDSEKAHWRLAEVIFKRSEEVADKTERRAMVERTVILAEQALAINPDSVGGLYWAGTACARLADMSGVFSAMKQIKQARIYLHRAVQADPDHRLSILAGVILALIYSESPWPLKDLDQALDLARRAVEKDPHLTIAALCLGKVYLARGDKISAGKELERCLAIEQPTYIWDAVLYDWPEARKILAGLE